MHLKSARLVPLPTVIADTVVGSFNRMVRSAMATSPAMFSVLVNISSYWESFLRSVLLLLGG